MTSAALPPDLAAAIERAYVVFAGYQFANTVGCACCNDDDVRELLHRRLTETPLRELSVGDVDYVCSELLTMWGDQEDAKVLAPRVLGLISAHPMQGGGTGRIATASIVVLASTSTLRPFLPCASHRRPAAMREESRSSSDRSGPT